MLMNGFIPDAMFLLRCCHMSRLHLRPNEHNGGGRPQSDAKYVLRDVEHRHILHWRADELDNGRASMLMFPLGVRDLLADGG